MKAREAISRALPRTLAGRVLLIIFAGLVVAHLASFLFFRIERAHALERFAAVETAARITEYARLPAEQAAAPSRFGPRTRLRWQPVSAVGELPPGGDAPSTIFAAELRRLLEENLGADPVVWISTREAARVTGLRSVGAERPPAPPGEPPPRGPDSRGEPFRGDGPFRGATPTRTDRAPRFVTVALKLPDGRQALAETMVFQPTIDIPSDVWISIALIFAVTAMFSILAVRLAVQPVRMLARAADRLSRNIDEPPLAEARGAAEIRSAARSFNRMQDRLRRHVNSRALAFAAMSHDLRTPLTRMRLRLESLGEPAKAKLGADLDEIEALTQAALETIRGLALDEAMATLEPDAMARQLVADYRAMGHALVVRGHASPLEARPQSLRRALVNVIDNAFKYAADVSLEIRDGVHEVTFEVADRGPGIPAEHLVRVLDPFYRVESSRNRDTGGSGLGLAIAKDIVEGHGGELVLANREGGGLSVTIRVPRAR